MIIALFSAVLLVAGDTVPRKDTLYMNETQYAFVQQHSFTGARIMKGSLADTMLFIDGEWVRREEMGEMFSFLCVYYLDWGERAVCVRQANGIRLLSFTNYGEGYLGSYREYYRDGSPKIIGQYSEDHPGRKIGEWLFYDENGQLIRKRKYHRK